MEWINVFNTIGLSGFIFTIATFLFKRHYEKKDKKEEKEDTIQIELLDIKSKMEIYEDNLKEVNKLIDYILEAQRALIREKIIYMYNTYYIAQKHLPIYERESLEHMYNSYKNLGGNGVIEDLIKDLFALPTELSTIS